MQKKEFWITNISNMNVSLTDLNLTVRSHSTINLLDAKHYSYTLEEIEQSVLNGSIAKKKDKIFVCKSGPKTTKNNIAFIKDAYMPTRAKSIFSIKEETYEELNLSDEQFAEENAETAELDRQPLFIKKEG